MGYILELHSEMQWTTDRGLPGNSGNYQSWYSNGSVVTGIRRPATGKPGEQAPGRALPAPLGTEPPVGL